MRLVEEISDFRFSQTNRYFAFIVLFYASFRDDVNERLLRGPGQVQAGEPEDNGQDNNNNANESSDELLDPMDQLRFGVLILLKLYYNYIFYKSLTKMLIKHTKSQEFGNLASQDSDAAVVDNRRSGRRFVIDDDEDDNEDEDERPNDSGNDNVNDLTDICLARLKF